VVDLIRAQHARLGFVTSIWPETWSLALGDIWRAGLPAVAFDIGAPAERIRRTGRGFLLSLGLAANAINDALVATSGITSRLVRDQGQNSTISTLKKGRLSYELNP
jgi:hypothetical protein